MPGRPTTLPTIQAALKRPATYDALPHRSRQAVDEMQRRIDAHDVKNRRENTDVEYEPDYRLLRLLKRIEREANP